MQIDAGKNHMHRESLAGGPKGSLLLIGGHEDREDDMTVLARFVSQCGGPDARIVVLTAASSAGEKMWAQYQAAFAALRVRHCSALHIERREEAADPARAAQLAAASGIFISGGNQKRLLDLTGGTALDAAMHAALARGACIAGTSAGASAMSASMLAHGRAELQPEKGKSVLGDGFGFVRHAVIDQHFSQRHRLPRLLAIVAQHPHLTGVGIDEDTALLIEGGGAIEVLGQGSVTVLDGRQLQTNVDAVAVGGTPEILDVRLHLLPAGARYRRGDRAPLAHFIDTITHIA